MNSLAYCVKMTVVERQGTQKMGFTMETVKLITLQIVYDSSIALSPHIF